MTERIKLAAAVAAEYHAVQKRKYTHEPYTVHLAAVAARVASAGGSEDDVVIAWLHDSVEDTSMTFTLLHKMFGETVAKGVWWLTDTHTDLGNRNTRKLLDRTRLAAAPPNIQMIKLCDLLDNTSSIMEHDPEFGERYLGEKLQLLRVMTRGDPQLWQACYGIIRDQAFYTDALWLTKYG